MYWYHAPFMWHDEWFSWSGWFGWLAPIIGLAIFIFVVFLIYKLIKNLFVGINLHHESHFESNDNSLKILNERFARGEIDEEEYKRLKNLILKH